MRCSPAASCRAGSARATRCASRRRCRCTATTSAPTTDAIEAGLGWTCALDAKEFTGADVLRRIKADGPARKLVSFVMEEKAVPRQGMPIVGGGVVTSGSHSPMLDVGIGMGYVPARTVGARHSAGRSTCAESSARRASCKRPIYKRED